MLIGRDRAGPAGDGRDADTAFVEGAFFGAEGVVRSDDGVVLLVDQAAVV